jgi:curved DNA-binding protein CbpA
VSATYTLYDLLGVTSSASLDEIKTAYYSGIRQYHPDINHAPNATQLLGMMNEAWETLRDTQRREQYDISIGLRGRSKARYENEPRSPQPSTVTRRSGVHPIVYVAGAVAVFAFWHYILIGAVIYGIGFIVLKRWRS